MLTIINSSNSMNATSFELKWPLTKTFKMLKEANPTHLIAKVRLYMFKLVCKEKCFLVGKMVFNFFVDVFEPEN